MTPITIEVINEFINKIQYYIGQQSHDVIVRNKDYDTDEFALLSELEYVLDYFDSIQSTDTTDVEAIALVDFFETRYNLNNLPYIVYTKRITSILSGYGVPSGGSVVSGSDILDVSVDNIYYGRFNKTWYNLDDRYSLLSHTHTVADITNLSSTLSSYALVSSLHTAVTLNTANGLFLSGQTLSLSLATPSNNGALSAIDKIKIDGFTNHNAVTIGTANGLSLSGQIISFGLATTLLSGAMSSADKIKLNGLINHDEVSLGITNGLSLTGQILSLVNATVTVSGAMSSVDKIKLNSLSNYTHPTGFTSQPASLLSASNVISRIVVNTNGHVTSIETRSLSLSNLGVIKGSLTRTNDTNVTLSLGGTPVDSLFESVSLTLGWTGLLNVDRGGTGAESFTSGQLLVGNGTSALFTISRSGIDTRTSFPPQSHTLTSHNDVSLTSPSAGQVLIFQGGIWVNSTITAAGVSITEVDPVFTAWKDTSRTANTFYSTPNGIVGIASFRTLLREDIPNIYIRFDTNTQGLSNTEKTNVLTNLGGQALLDTSDVVGDSSITITNPTNRVIGTTNLIINHVASGWAAKTTLVEAVIISNLTVNTSGHISDWTTRTLTLADLGYAGFDPTSIQTSIDDHEVRIASLEIAFPGLSGDKNFVHPQAAAATIWNFTHNMGKKPSVTIIDSAGSVILAKLTYIDLNNIEIDFNGSLTSGEAICN